MQNSYHILNGDALKQQFPPQIPGEQVVMRECLVDGPVADVPLEDFFQMRAVFIAESYGDSIAGYHDKVVLEFDKIRKIPDNAEINLWFEDDLFCQVNFWFVVYFISGLKPDAKLFLIRPPFHSHYGFGGLNESELLEAFTCRTQIFAIDRIAQLWKAYQQNDMQKLKNQAVDLSSSYPFIRKAVQAHIDRIPTGSDPGRPARAIIEIKDELETDDFGAVFKAFCRRESIYGFGDAQVKRLYDEVVGKDQELNS